MRHRWALPLALVPLLGGGALVFGQTASGGSAAAAQTLVRQIQAPVPALSEAERKGFLRLFSTLEAARVMLDEEEQRLLAQLTADQADLKRHAQSTADYELDLGAWQLALRPHRTACGRTFTNPADVERCDRQGAQLAQTQKALDARADQLESLGQALRARQAQTTMLVADLLQRQEAWRVRLDTEFTSPLRKALARKVGTTTLRLTLKSFISVVDLSSLSKESRPQAERAFARFTNANFSENPSTPAPDAGDFRLWSQTNVVASCRGDRISAWKTSHLAHRSGLELRVLDAETSIMEPLGILPAAQGTDDIAALTLTYGIKGRPNDLALPSFHAVAPRSCHSIWHRVEATVTCQDGTAVAETRITGSRFPSHRMWVNDNAVATKAQGPFSALWDCDASAPDLVR